MADIRDRAEEMIPVDFDDREAFGMPFWFYTSLLTAVYTISTALKDLGVTDKRTILEFLTGLAGFVSVEMVALLALFVAGLEVYYLFAGDD